MQEGLESGAYLARIETAKRMRDYGDSLEKVLAITGLTKDQIIEAKIF